MLRKHSLHFLITITHLSIMFAAWYGQRPRPRCLAVATRGISPRDFGTIIKTRFLPNKARRQYPAALKIQHKQGPSKTISLSLASRAWHIGAGTTHLPSSQVPAQTYLQSVLHLQFAVGRLPVHTKSTHLRNSKDGLKSVVSRAALHINYLQQLKTIKCRRPS